MQIQYLGLLDENSSLLAISLVSIKLILKSLIILFDLETRQKLLKIKFD